jgi:hypothetical protein
MSSARSNRSEPEKARPPVRHWPFDCRKMRRPYPQPRSRLVDKPVGLRGQAPIIQQFSATKRGKYSHFSTISKDSEPRNSYVTAAPCDENYLPCKLAAVVHRSSGLLCQVQHGTMVVKRGSVGP